MQQEPWLSPIRTMHLPLEGRSSICDYVAPRTFLCLSLVELMSSCRNWDWIWYSRFLSRAASASYQGSREERMNRCKWVKRVLQLGWKWGKKCFRSRIIVKKELIEKFFLAKDSMYPSIHPAIQLSIHPSIHQSFNIFQPCPTKNPTFTKHSRLDSFVNYAIANKIIISLHGTLFSCSNVPRSCSW